MQVVKHKSNSLLSSSMIRSQLSKHSPHGSQYGICPVVPLAQRSHLWPPIPGKHSHFPVLRSQCNAADPAGSHSQAETRNSQQ